MRTLLLIGRLILILIMGTALLEYKTSIVERMVKDALLSYKIEAKEIKWVRLNRWIFVDISKEGTKIAKKAEIVFNPLSLLSDQIYINGITVTALNLKAIPTRQKQEKKEFDKSIFIENLSIEGYFEKIDLEASVKDIEIDRQYSFKLANLRLNSSKFNLSAVAKAKKSKIYAKGAINLHKFRKPVNFRAEIGDREIAFNASTEYINEKDSIKLLLNAEGFYYIREKTLTSDIKASGSIKNAKIFATAKATFDKELHADIKGYVRDIKKSLPILTDRVDFTGTLKDDLLIGSIFNAKNKIDFTLNRELEFNVAAKNLRLPHPQAAKLLGSLSVKAWGKKSSFGFKIDSKLFTALGEFGNDVLSIYFTQKDTTEERLKAIFPIYAVFDPKTKKLQSTSALFNVKADFSKYPYRIYLNGEGAKAAIEIAQKYLRGTIDIYDPKRFLKSAQKIVRVPNRIEAESMKVSLLSDYVRTNFEITAQNLKIKNGDIQLINIKGRTEGSTLFVDYYAIVANNRAVYATKESQFLFENGKIVIKRLWIEDQIKATGFIDLKKICAHIKLRSKLYRFSFAEGKVDSKIDIKAQIEADKIAIEGEIEILGGTVWYDPQKHKEISDPDIVVVDAPRKKEFTQNLILNLRIKSSKTLIYQLKYLEAEIDCDVTLWKEYQKPTELLGVVKIEKGVFRFKDRTFRIKGKEFDFYGPIENPLLNLDIVYKKEPYTVYIKIAGELKNPVITFRSEPYLNQNDILALLLFDSISSTALAKGVLGESFSKALGNLFVKDLISSFGMRLDRFSLITSSKGFGIEIGKNIGKKITVIYRNDEISSIILRYRVSPNLKAEASFSPENSGAEIIYQIEN